MADTVTVTITVPTFKVSKAFHQRISALSAVIAAGAVAITTYGPGFGLPAADAVYASSAVTFVATILRAVFPTEGNEPAVVPGFPAQQPVYGENPPTAQP